MLPQARQVHEAEVLLGDLLHVVGGAEQANPEEVTYDFHPGVRELLLDTVRTERSLAVLKGVSQYVERHLGLVAGFRTLLDDPSAAPPAGSPGESNIESPTYQVVLRLGG